MKHLFQLSLAGGYGVYDEALEPPFGVTRGCTKCGGSGGLLWTGAGAADRSTLRQGSGKMPCPTCGGSGH